MYYNGCHQILSVIVKMMQELINIFVVGNNLNEIFLKIVKFRISLKVSKLPSSNSMGSIAYENLYASLSFHEFTYARLLAITIFGIGP